MFDGENNNVFYYIGDRVIKLICRLIDCEKWRQKKKQFIRRRKRNGEINRPKYEDKKQFIRRRNREV